MASNPSKVNNVRISAVTSDVAGDEPHMVMSASAIAEHTTDEYLHITALERDAMPPLLEENNKLVSEAMLDTELISRIQNRELLPPGEIVKVSSGVGGATLVQIGNVLYAAGFSAVNAAVFGISCTNIHKFMPIYDFEHLGIRDFSTSGLHSCVIDGNGMVWTSGSNLDGELGLGFTSAGVEAWRNPQIGQSLVGNGTTEFTRCECTDRATVIWNDYSPNWAYFAGHSLSARMGMTPGTWSTFRQLDTYHWETMVNSNIADDVNMSETVPVSAAPYIATRVYSLDYLSANMPINIAYSILAGERLRVEVYEPLRDMWHILDSAGNVHANQTDGYAFDWGWGSANSGVCEGFIHSCWFRSGTVPQLRFTAYSLNDGTDDTDLVINTIRRTAAPIKNVACSLLSTMVLYEDGVMMACGDNSNGELGKGDTTAATYFQVVNPVPGAVVDEIQAYSYGYVARSVAGRMYRCGNDVEGYIDDDAGMYPDWKEITWPESGVDGRAVSFNAGRHIEDGTGNYQHLFIITNTDTIYNKGSSSRGTLPGRTTDLNVWQQALAILTFSNRYISTIYGRGLTKFGIDNSGELWCWGDNEHGQLGIDQACNSTVHDAVIHPIIAEARRIHRTN